jgi:NDP-sugar pyrophosphorylase family protein
MKTVILAAGKGTRMGDMTKETPKPLLMVAGKHLLAHKLDVVAKFSTEICIVVSHMSEKIIDEIGDSWNEVPILYAFQKEMRGTADALLCAREFVGDEPFLVLMGDDIYDELDLENLSECQWGMLVYDSSNPKNEGKIIIDENENLKDIVDDGKGLIQQNLVCTGAYMLQPEYFSWQPELVAFSKEVGIPFTLRAHAHEKEIKVIITKNWYMINSPEQLALAEEKLML